MNIYKFLSRVLVWLTVGFAMMVVLSNPASASGNYRYGPAGPIFNQFGGLGVGIGGIGKGGSGGHGGAGGHVFSPRQHRFASMAYAPSIQPSSDCRNPFSIGGAGPMAGISTGWTYEDDQCAAREGLRVVGSLKAYGIYSDKDANDLVQHATCKLTVYADSPYCVTYLASLQPKKPEGGNNVSPPQTGTTFDPHKGPERKVKLEDMFSW